MTVDTVASRKPDESQLADVREYAPQVGKHLDALEAENAELRRNAGIPAQHESAFAPDELDPEVQAAVDEVPELLLWHASPEHQDKWSAAKAADRLLQHSTAFDGKPLSERLAEVVRLVREKVVTPSKASSAKTLEDAQRVIAAATPAPAGAAAVGDLRGGAHAATNSFRDPHAMAKAGASDEEIMASLPR